MVGNGCRFRGAPVLLEQRGGSPGSTCKVTRSQTNQGFWPTGSPALTGANCQDSRRWINQFHRQYLIENLYVNCICVRRSGISLADRQC